MNKVERFFDEIFSTVANVLMASVMKLAKFMVPIPPAWYWSHVIANSTGNQWVGISAAIVLEIGGILAARNAVTYWGTAKGKLAAIFTGLYLFIGVGVMWLMDAADQSEKWVITAVFAIAGMVYVLSGMTEAEVQQIAKAEVDEAWQREEQAKEAEHKRQLENKQLELEAQNQLQVQLAHEQAEIAIAETKAQVSIARAEAKARTNGQTNRGQTEDKPAPIVQTETDRQKAARWPELSHSERVRLLDLTPDEIVSQYGVSTKTAGRWTKRAAALPSVHQNGMVKDV